MREQVHVTAVRNGCVYGHTTEHCDPAGCAGDEMYFADAPAGIEPGELYDPPKTYTYTNRFHRTEFRSRKSPNEIERLRYIVACCASSDPEYRSARAYVRKMWRTLCGAKGCTCADECGRR